MRDKWMQEKSQASFLEARYILPISGVVPEMGKIGNIGDLDLKNYCFSFCSRYVNINNYHISFLKMIPFEVRNVEIKSIQFDAKWYLFKIFQNYIIKCFSSGFAIVHYQIYCFVIFQ
jgi:hypothetical protein